MGQPHEVVRVVNVSRGEVLAGRVRLAVGFWARAVGLLGRRGLRADEGLLIAPCQSVHMLGMRFAIDVVYVGEGVGVGGGGRRARAVTATPGGGRVLRVVRGLRPWRIGPIVRGARAVIELPVGAVASLRVGDDLGWEVAPVRAGP